MANINRPIEFHQGEVKKPKSKPTRRPNPKPYIPPDRGQGEGGANNGSR